MKKTIVVLGNGFDLDLGWKTSYRDFYLAKMKNYDVLNGNDYIKEMCEGEHWYDLEGYLRKCVEEVDESRLKVLQEFWCICLSFLKGYLGEKRNFESVYQTKEDRCAKYFLQNLPKMPVFSFNYTEPFKYLDIDDSERIEHIHGNIGKMKIKLGVDLSVKSKYSGNDLLKPLFKAYENDKKDMLLDAMKRAETIVFYGLSFGITDSDYFKGFFDNIANNRFVEKRFFFVTLNPQSLQSIKNNMATYGIDYDKMVLSNNELIPIYTERGKSDKGFQEMMDCIKEY